MTRKYFDDDDNDDDNVQLTLSTACSYRFNSRKMLNLIILLIIFLIARILVVQTCITHVIKVNTIHN